MPAPGIGFVAAVAEFVLLLVSPLLVVGWSIADVMATTSAGVGTIAHLSVSSVAIRSCATVRRSHACHDQCWLNRNDNAPAYDMLQAPYNGHLIATGQFPAPEYSLPAPIRVYGLPTRSRGSAT